MKTIKTNEVVSVLNYPYGFKLKTTLTDYLEFNPSKGYRHCTSTIDPRNGRQNKPKKSTYSALIVRYYNEDNHIKTIHLDFNGDKEINKGCKFVAENFDLFTPEEIKYIYNTVLSMSYIDCKATCIYGGSKAEDLKPFYVDFWTICKAGIKAPENNFFPSLILDGAGIDATKPENFNPFTIKTYEIV